MSAFSVGINSATALRGLSSASAQSNKAFQRLSSGLRINQGSDDPSGLVLSQLLRSQTLGTEQAIRNSQDAYNVLSIAEGGLSSVAAQLTQMRELAVHALNSGVTSPAQVAADQAELNSSIQTIARVTDTTSFSDQKLLNGASNAMNFQLGEGGGVQDRDQFSLGSYNPANLGVVEIGGERYSMNDLLGGGKASLANDPQAALQVIDQAIADVSAGRAQIGAYQANSLATNINNLEVTLENLIRTESAIADTDMAQAITDLTSSQIREQVSLKMIQAARVNAQTVSRLLIPF